MRDVTLKRSIEVSILRIKCVALMALCQDSVVGNCYCWTVLGSYPGAIEILHVRPDRPWFPFNLLYYRLRISFPRIERPRLCVGHPPHLEPKHYFPPCVPSITSYGATFIFNNISCINPNNYFFLTDAIYIYIYIYIAYLFMCLLFRHCYIPGYS